MDILAPLTYLPLRLSGNQIAYTIDAADEAITDRSGLAYYLCIKKPKAYLSGEFEDLITLPGREEPEIVEMGASYYPGAQFDIAVFLADYLKRTVPRPNQVDVDLCGELTMPYYVQSWIENDGALVADSTKTRSLEYVMRGRLDTEGYAVWRSEFFTTYLSETRRFLTWQPAEKWIDSNQPEFLYFLVNFNPRPTQLRLRVALTFVDETLETLTLQTVSSINQYSIYGFPVGFTALGLADQETAGTKIHSYQVWIANELNQRLSEVRTYYLSQEFEPNVLFLLFANSLGGYDTLRCTGQTSRSLAVKGTTLQTVLAIDYLPSTAELLSLNRLGERTLTVNTGLLSGEKIDYLSELSLSDEIYVATQEGFVALLPPDGAMALRADDENLAGRTLTFRLAKNEVGFSNLPTAPQTPERPLLWSPINPYCLINDNGIRTGLIASSTLELRYADDNSIVKPRRTKPNLPGTQGYTPPVASELCATTPFQNMLIQKPGTFRRNNCPTDQEGTVATLTIAAGTFGAETAEQLQSRIDQALVTMDTQAYANSFGSCLLNPANYSVSVPSGKWHYRAGIPARIGIYYAGSPAMGNAWNVQGQPGTFAQGSNDLDFSASHDPYGWRIFTYGTPGQSARLRVYVDNVLKKDRLFVYNSDGYENHLLFVTDADVVYAVPALSKIYVRITDS